MRNNSSCGWFARGRRDFHGAALRPRAVGVGRLRLPERPWRTAPPPLPLGAEFQVNSYGGRPVWRTRRGRPNGNLVVVWGSVAQDEDFSSGSLRAAFRQQRARRSARSSKLSIATLYFQGRRRRVATAADGGFLVALGDQGRGPQTTRHRGAPFRFGRESLRSGIAGESARCQHSGGAGSCESGRGGNGVAVWLQLREPRRLRAWRVRSPDRHRGQPGRRRVPRDQCVHSRRSERARSASRWGSRSRPAVSSSPGRASGQDGSFDGVFAQRLRQHHCNPSRGRSSRSTPILRAASARGAGRGRSVGRFRRRLGELQPGRKRAQGVFGQRFCQQWSSARQRVSGELVHRKRAGVARPLGCGSARRRLRRRAWESDDQDLAWTTGVRPALREHRESPRHPEFQVNVTRPEASGGPARRGDEWPVRRRLDEPRWTGRLWIRRLRATARRHRTPAAETSRVPAVAPRRSRCCCWFAATASDTRGQAGPGNG